ncbi:hypothetical protein TSAR_002709 [Trichomalopsis sarcophagae]|uniref:N-acetyltransferase domain-containing protein n=1 Tax=Trichomalopsis sarcophagae TaxID=543379 RepID=A0A232FF37_9HYME|nr:hypothetical protein TSAR_002709 [Trichomalopsis sarcophagae]
MDSEGYTTRKAEKSEASAIVSFLHEHHSPEAVITKGFFAKNRARITDAEIQLMDESWEKFVSEAPSLVTIHKASNQIVGAIVLVPVDNPNLYSEEKPSGERSKILDEFDVIFERIYAEVNLVDRFPQAKRAMKLRSMAVHKDHRGKGLAKVLLRESVNWAKKHGFDLVHSFFTFPAAKKAALRSGFSKVMDYDMHSVKDTDGSCAFADLSPNNVTSIMALEIR